MIYLLDVIIVVVHSLGYKMLSCDFLQIKTVSAAGKMEAHTTHEVKETHKSQEVQRLTQFTRTPVQGNTLSKQRVGKGGFLT